MVLWPSKRRFLERLFFPVFPYYLFWQNIGSNIIGQRSINQIFHLQKKRFSYRLDYHKSILILKLEVGKYWQVIYFRLAYEGVSHRQEVSLEQAELFYRVLW